MEQTNYYLREIQLNDQYENLASLIDALVKSLGKNDLTAYLVMMSVRLIELHRILKSTGSLYLHCDPNASHYIKLVLDAVFGFESFENEIIWKSGVLKGAKGISKKFGRLHDVIFFYTKSAEYLFNKIHKPYDLQSKHNKFKFTDIDGRIYSRDTPLGDYSEESIKKFEEQGRIYVTSKGKKQLIRYLDELPGLTVGDIWDDINPINQVANERMGYPTQKPEALLERIIKASSNEGDLVLDPFCGCGTTIAVAERLKRHWIGIDITWLSVDLMERRLKDSFDHGYISELMPYEVLGAPKDVASAIALAERDKYQFQYWACSLVNAAPYQGGKKGADTGIDGIRTFLDGQNGQRQKIIVQVKGGKHVSSPHIRDLSWVVEREKAAIGVYICLTEPTKDMKDEKNRAGLYETPDGKCYPKIQILTIHDLLFDHKKIDMPFTNDSGHNLYKKAEFKTKDTSKEGDLFD